MARMVKQFLLTASLALTLFSLAVVSKPLDLSDVFERGGIQAKGPGVFVAFLPGVECSGAVLSPTWILFMAKCVQEYRKIRAPKDTVIVLQVEEKRVQSLSIRHVLFHSIDSTVPEVNPVQLALIQTNLTWGVQQDFYLREMALPASYGFKVIIPVPERNFDKDKLLFQSEMLVQTRSGDCETPVLTLDESDRVLCLANLNKAVKSCDILPGTPLFSRESSRGEFLLVGFLNAPPCLQGRPHIFKGLKRQSFLPAMVVLPSLRSALNVLASTECQAIGHQVIDDFRRQTSYYVHPTSNADRICDIELKEGWYRFSVGGNAAEIPTTCPALHSCGTTEPMWLQMTRRPEPGKEVTVDACRVVSFEGKTLCCAWKLETKVRNCGNFLVYRLQPASQCPSGYCLNEMMTEPKEIEKTLQPDEKRSRPSPVNPLPILSRPFIMVQEAEMGKVNFTCNFLINGHTGADVVYQVTWFRPVQFYGGRSGRVAIFSDVVSNSPSIYSVRLGKDLDLGGELFCEVQAKNQVMKTRGKAEVSSLYPVGVKIEPPSLFIAEDLQIADIRFTSTVPIRCIDGSDKCSLKVPIYLMFDDLSTKRIVIQPGITLSTCEVEIARQKCTPSGCGSTNISVSAVADFVDDGTTITRIATAAVQTFDQVDGWVAYDPPDVEITVQDIKTSRCTLLLDGLVLKGNNRNTTVMRPGTYILYESLSRPFEIHARLWPCSRKQTASCTCGIAVREESEVLSFDMCNGTIGETRVRSSILKSAGPNRRKVRIARSNQGKRLIVYFPTGVFIRMDTFEWGMNVYVQSSSVDHGGIGGLCSPLVFKDARGREVHPRVAPARSLFSSEHVKLVTNSPVLLQPEKKEPRCACSIETAIALSLPTNCNTTAGEVCNRQFVCPHAERITSPVLNFERDITLAVYAMQETEGTDYEFVWDTNPVSDDTSNIIEAGALLDKTSSALDVKRCQETLRKLPATTVCRKFGGFSIENISVLCSRSRQITDEPALALFGLVESTCEEIAVRNLSSWSVSPNSAPLPSLEIQAEFCPNFCSNRGRCKDGICFCDKGYMSVDCSIEEGKAPKVIGVEHDNICDVSRSSCTKVTVVGSGFMEGSEAKCAMVPSVFANNTWHDVEQNIVADAMFESFRDVKCMLPAFRLPPWISRSDVISHGFHVSVTNDQRMLSNSVFLTVHNGNCVHCVKGLTDGSCFIKKESCLIDGICLKENSTQSVDGKCKICLPKISQKTWTTLHDNPKASLKKHYDLLLREELKISLAKSGIFSYRMLRSSKYFTLTKEGLLRFVANRLGPYAATAVVTNVCGISSKLKISVLVTACPCQHKGQCDTRTLQEIQRGKIKCKCMDGYSGKLCEKVEDPCRNDSCIFGTCQGINGKVQCTCNAGYKGQRCDVISDPCKILDCPGQCILRGDGSGVCRMHSTSIPSITQPKPSAKTEAIPNAFQITLSPTTSQKPHVPKNPCIPNPCRAGYCRINKGSFFCRCPPTKQGRLCEKANLCFNNPCNNGMCENLGETFRCNCKVGFTGRYCDSQQDHCLSGPCIKGECISAGSDYKCSCLTGYSGKNCDVEMDFCSSDPCKYGECRARPGGFRCACHNNYTGILCETAIDPCKSSPCVNGQCISNSTSYSCKCKEGFTGSLCETRIDPCKSSPCVNGLCISDRSGFWCNCIAGFAGELCDKKIDLCQSSPCINGVCTTLVAGFACECRPGFTGELCETEIDPCQSSPCINGICDSIGVNFTCSCQNGFTGKLCEKRIDPCKINPCRNGSCIPWKCKNSTCEEGKAFQCKCVTGFTGAFCESPFSPCIPSPCVHGDCVEVNSSYTCKCPRGFQGKQCEARINFCAANPCKHGQCKQLEFGFRCICDKGFVGPLCELKKDYCKENPCVNGTCLSLDTGYICQCFSGFVGKQCERKKPSCNTSPCEHGRCLELKEDYYCKCDTGWKGKDCNERSNFCIPNPCVNGICTSIDNSYSCDCSPDFSGRNCEIAFDPCLSLICHHGTCINNSTTAFCKCDEGYQGTKCEQIQDFCLSNPCLHNSTCESIGGGFRCNCLENYEGSRCEKWKDECKSNPCSHGACLSLSNSGFRCSCEVGFTGKFCDTKENACESNPCKHGSCEAGDYSYRCKCDAGYKGKNCELRDDPCASRPCGTGGICLRFTSSYYCQCFRGFLGNNCEKRDACAFHTCKNNGECYVRNNTAVCECKLGFAGKQCEDNLNSCIFYRCLNGTCVDTPEGPICHCQPGYTGNKCETVHDKCLIADNCVKGDCIGKGGTSSCLCYPGYTGDLCDTSLDICKYSNPCNHGTCSSAEGKARCSCFPGYTGKYCNNTIDFCQSNPCRRGTCVNERNSSLCICPTGYSGLLCDVIVDPCMERKPCLHGKCVAVGNLTKCSCDKHYTGEDCENQIQYCHIQNPCKQGDCIGTFGSLYCRCQQGYGGKYCDSVVDPCSTASCVHGACKPQNTTFHCECEVGWTGTRCESRIDFCASSPCKHGVCMTESGKDYMCQCAKGWSGKQCDYDVDECRGKPCPSGSGCINTIGNYSCKNCLDKNMRDHADCIAFAKAYGSTPKPFTQERRSSVTTPNSKNSAPCSAKPCHPLVTCENVVDREGNAIFRCGSCPQGYSGNGRFCRQKACGPESCFKGVKCYETQNSYRCGRCPFMYRGNGKICKPICRRRCPFGMICKAPSRCGCPPGYAGFGCKVPVCINGCFNGGQCIKPDTCRCPSGFGGRDCRKRMCAVLCRNGGECLNGDRCKCPFGYNGKYCKNVACKVKCQNGGTCDTPFKCRCPAGFEGDVCQHPKCNPPCRNGGQCLAQGKCLCQFGFHGNQCERSICLPACLNNGICIRPGQCVCAEGYSGRRCQTPVCEFPCQNGGRCVGPNKCSCSYGFEGRMCERALCSRSCKNGGTCIRPNVCLCPYGFSGLDCSYAWLGI